MNNPAANPLSMNRRGVIASLLAASAAAALSACSQPREAGGTQEVSTTFADGDAFFSQAEMALIAVVAETIIPATDTPGAIGAGVPGVIQGLASDWGDDDYRKFMRGGLQKLGQRLQALGGQAFGNMPASVRKDVLSKYDAQMFRETAIVETSEEQPTSYGNADDDSGANAAQDEALRKEFYKTFKRTVATAYYMSEPGATEELAYEAVPGEWIGDAPLSDYPKTWAT